MNIKKQYTNVFEYDLVSNLKKTIENDDTYTRICYLLQLNHIKTGYQWIMTEFDVFSSDINDFLIPSKLILKNINNLSIKSSNGLDLKNLNNGHIMFTPFNYIPINDIHLKKHFMKLYENQGNYGCMQLYSGENVIWAFNKHNSINHDLGINNNINNEYKDWTFMSNSNEYTSATLNLYTVRNKILFDSNQYPKIDLTGVVNGDSLIYNHLLNTFSQVKIKYNSQYTDISKPNFIIALTGQSNSQGWNAFYELDNIHDQTHDRIFGFNSTSQSWEIADLNTESTGSFWHKPAGFQSLAFHFAKRLVEGYPDIRPGIINLGIAGQSIARWAKFSENDKWYTTNVSKANDSNAKQGDIYEHHVNKIDQALSQIDIKYQNIDVICWHQGESDGFETNQNYYTDSLKQVIQQYRNLKYCNSKTPFIVGKTTGGDIGINKGWESRNLQLQNLNLDGDPYTKCVECLDLETSDGQYNNGDNIHFSANSQRIMGSRYFKAFRSIFEN